MARDSAVLQPNLGLYLGRFPLAIPKRALKSCLNVRIKNKSIVRDNVGWGAFPSGDVPLNLDNKPVTLIDNFFPRAGGQLTMFANTTDIFEYLETTETVAYLTPRYETGTVDVTNGSATVTGTGTTWSSNLKAGDFIHIGAAGERDPAAIWYEIQSVDSDTQLTLTAPYAEATVSGAAYSARLTQTGDLADYYETAIFFNGANLTSGGDGDRWYATNGVDRILAWDGAVDQCYYPDLGNLETARFIIPYKNIMIFGNITLDTGENRPFSVRTSAIGEPENTTTLEAAEFVVHDGADPLLTGFTIGENLALYAERSITLTQFVGPPTIFVFRTVVDGIGPRAGRAIADFGDFHKFIGSDTQYTFDGISIVESNAHIWQEVLRTMSPQRLDMILSHFDEENGELDWVVPLNTDADTTDGPPERAYIEHYLEEPGGDAPDVHTLRELPATAMGFYERLTTLTFDQLTDTWADQNYRWDDQFLQATFPFNVLGTADGDLFVLGTKDTKNGVPMTSFARFGRRPLGSLRTKGVIRRVYPMTETLPAAEHDLEVRLHTSDQPNGSTALEKVMQYDLTQSTTKHFVTPRLAARYVEVEFRTEGAGHIWSLAGYDMDVVRGPGR